MTGEAPPPPQQQGRAVIGGDSIGFVDQPISARDSPGSCGGQPISAGDEGQGRVDRPINTQDGLSREAAFDNMQAVMARRTEAGAHTRPLFGSN